MPVRPKARITASAVMWAPNKRTAGTVPLFASSSSVGRRVNLEVIALPLQKPLMQKHIRLHVRSLQNTVFRGDSWNEKTLKSGTGTTTTERIGHQYCGHRAEISETWPCGRRALSIGEQRAADILSVIA